MHSSRYKRTLILTICAIWYLSVPSRGSCHPAEWTVDGRTRQVARSAPVHSAGSQLPLEGTERYQMAQMVKIKIVYRDFVFEAPSSDDVDELGRSRGSQVAPHTN